MITVLLTGAGGAATPGLIARLRAEYGYRVLAADMNPHAIGLYYADKSFVIPPAISPHFLPAVRDICLQESVDVFVPLVDEELLPALELEAEGIVVLTPRRAFVEICLDKFVLMQKLSAGGIPVPMTHLASDDNKAFTFPAIVKPRTGRGSRGVGKVQSQTELTDFVKASPYSPETLVVQSLIEGAEFTVSVAVWRDGEVQAIVPKEIICKKGITSLAVTRRNERIDHLCRTIQTSLRADGPFNVQLCLDKISGQPLPFEINPRFSTTVSLTIAAGVDEVGVLVRQAIDPAGPRLVNEWRAGLVLLRRTLDEFVDEADFYARDIVNLCNEDKS